MKFFQALRNLFRSKSPSPRKGETFAEWFNRQGLKHFTAREFEHLCARPRGSVRNSTPPRALWSNMLPGLRVLDTLRGVTGSPIVLHSTYRSPAYNDAVRGAPLSQHLKARAFDFSVPGYTPHEIFKILQTWRAQGQFIGGLGLYRSFVHLDTRGSLATWDQS
jgi:uncharacterized protein YcbK (DUF882 family)